MLGVWPEDDANEDLAPRWDAAIRWHLAMMHQDMLRATIAEARQIEPKQVSVRDMMNAVPDEEVAEALKLVTNLTESLEDQPFTMGKSEQSLADMRAVIDFYAEEGQIPVKYVIIDPLLAVTDTSIGSNPAARSVLWPLMRMAKETGVAVMLTHHTTKDGKVAGSKGITDVLRLVYMATWDAKNPDMVIVHKDKGNNVGRVRDVRYSMAGSEQSPYVVWELPEEPPAPKAAAPPAPPKKKASPVPTWRTRYAQPPAPASAPAAPAPVFVGTNGRPRPSVAIWGQH